MRQKFLLAAMMLVVIPAQAQQQAAQDNPRLHVTALPAAFNEAANRMSRRVRMRTISCRSGDRVATCTISLSEELQAVTAAADDRTTLRSMRFIASPMARTSVRVDLFEATLTAVEVLAPHEGVAARSQAVTELLRSTASYQSDTHRVTLGALHLGVVRMPGQDAAMVSIERIR